MKTIPQPLWDYVIMERDSDLVKMIIEPSNADPNRVPIKELRVILVGPDCNNIKIGDRLIFNGKACQCFDHENKKYWLISERATGVVIAPERKINKTPDAKKLPN